MVIGAIKKETVTKEYVTDKYGRIVKEITVKEYVFDDKE